MVASAGAITVAIVAGFPAATLVALACYLAALAHDAGRPVAGDLVRAVRPEDRTRR